LTFEFKFADIGEGVHEGEILQWHVKAGDVVTKDQLVVEVMTEKVNVEIAAPVPGKINELKFGEGEVVKVGEVMFIIEESGSSEPKKKQPAQAKDKPKEKEKLLKLN
jgi:pyruvate dehydrogenase E2 component (dihydrolipoamide acetyltransferase)